MIFSCLSNKCNDDTDIKCDIVELEDEFIIIMEASGLEKQDIRLVNEDKNLIIETSRKRLFDYDTYIHTEMDYSLNSRKFFIGETDKNDIKAKLENGLLQVFIPKWETSEQEIKIK